MAIFHVTFILFRVFYKIQNDALLIEIDQGNQFSVV